MKTIRFKCSECGQPFEAAPETRGMIIECPGCKSKTAIPKRTPFDYKPVAFILVLIALSLGWPRFQTLMFLNHDNNERTPPAETNFQRLHRWREEAQKDMVETASKDTVGFRRMIDSYVFDTGDDPYKWTGEVHAEYINKAGGVEATNIPYRFMKVQRYNGQEQIAAIIDIKKILDADTKAFNDRMKAMASGN